MDLTKDFCTLVYKTKLITDSKLFLAIQEKRAHSNKDEKILIEIICRVADGSQ